MTSQTAPSDLPRRPFGPTGRQVPVVGQGTWDMEKEPRAAVEALRHGLDLSLTHVDTAEMYGDGRVEELVGEAIAGRREEVFLVSKVLPENASRRGTSEACRRSLERLRTDHLDVYLLHWPGSHPLADTLAAFGDLVEEGRIRSWGVSNFDEDELAQAIEIAGEDRIACNQVLYHLGERSVEHAVLPFCRDHGIALVAYSPLGSGDFPAPSSRGGRVLAEIARDRQATPQQVALAFLLRHPGLFVVPKASRREHVNDNAAAAGLELSGDEIDRLDCAFPCGPRRPGVPTL